MEDPKSSTPEAFPISIFWRFPGVRTPARTKAPGGGRWLLRFGSIRGQWRFVNQQADPGDPADPCEASRAKCLGRHLQRLHPPHPRRLGPVRSG